MAIFYPALSYVLANRSTDLPILSLYGPYFERWSTTSSSSSQAHQYFVPTVLYTSILNIISCALHRTQMNGFETTRDGEHTIPMLLLLLLFFIGKLNQQTHRPILSKATHFFPPFKSLLVGKKSIIG